MQLSIYFAFLSLFFGQAIATPVPAAPHVQRQDIVIGCPDPAPSGTLVDVGCVGNDGTQFCTSVDCAARTITKCETTPDGNESCEDIKF
ncbi:hypothetical protein DFH09DRAFT_1317013 [Mycena vulgaris]|nr:hypothetical protein DFH09DRAFT_1317013 [Mycena vulgaris]